MKIKNITAREVKNSRGRPAVEVILQAGKLTFTASCPSGTSTGKNEALELLDADTMGVSKAINNVNNIIAPKLKGKDTQNQAELDIMMINLDGTYNKSALGVNAILPVSMAICRSGAFALKMPLYQYIAKLSGNSNKIPFGSFNILNGGLHAENDLEIQEFMVVPQKKTFQENMAVVNNIFNNLTNLLIKQFGELPVMGYEGGYAPHIARVEQALLLIKNAIGNQDAKIALDCAASEFYQNGKYYPEPDKEFSREQMAEFYKELINRFPIISIEDPFAQEDWDGFALLRQQFEKLIIIGDDLTTTNLKKIKEAQNKGACNGVIIKPNQIGTVSESIEAANLAKSYGWKIVVSHRSGETMDSFIADLAVGLGADFIKAGCPTQEERMIKYKRIMEIEKEIKK